MPIIDLSEREIIVLRSALDSAEYWEHRDDLPHDSGYILNPDMLDPLAFDVEEIKSSEAWEEVLEIRALDARLAELQVDSPCARCGHSASDHGGGDGEGEYPDLPCICGCDRWTEEEG